jgi:AraC family transcriptional regulator
MKTLGPDSLQARTLMRGRGSRYWAKAEGLPLSLKCMRNGRARYVVGRNEFCVDDAGWLIVNEDQRYTIEIASETELETFIVWFPRGWAEEVWRSATTSAARLLDTPAVSARTSAVESVTFFERYTPNDSVVSPLAEQLRRANNAAEPTDAGWLEEKLRTLLAALCDEQRELRTRVARMPALKAATREELWRRLNRARDFIHARCTESLSLTAMAEAAALSPYHFLRAFRSAFGATPHDWLTACRIERAKFLLARTEMPVTEVCFASGYEGLGSFSTLFRRLTGASPRTWRRANGTRGTIRNFGEVFGGERVLSSAAAPPSS